MLQIVPFQREYKIDAFFFILFIPKKELSRHKEGAKAQAATIASIAGSMLWQAGAKPMAQDFCWLAGRAKPA